MYYLGNLDLVISDVCKSWDQRPQKPSHTAVQERSTAWCRSFDCIEQVLKALLAYEGVIIKGPWMPSASDPYHKKILEGFDDEHSVFHKCLGVAAEHHVVRFRRTNDNPHPNEARVALERLRTFQDWYQSWPGSSTRLRHFNGIQMNLPDSQDLRKDYTTIMHALVKAISFCAEGAHRQSVASHHEYKWCEVDQANNKRASSLASNQLALSSSGDGASVQSDHEWGFVQSTPKLSPPTIRKSVPASSTSQTIKKVLDKMKADKDCKATISPLTTAAPMNFRQVVHEPVSTPSTRNTRAPNASPVPMMNQDSWNGSQKRVTASSARVLSTAAENSTEIIATIKWEAEVLIEAKLAEHIRFLNQELANEKTSREVEKRGHIAYITKLNHELTKAKKNFAILLENDHRCNEALSAAYVSKAEVQKALKDAAKAKQEAERERDMGRHKLELTYQENASLKKEIKRAREKGREDIRTQVSGALNDILSPSLR